MKASTIDEYIDQFPKEVQLLLESVRLAIRQIAPEGVETISYAIPTFKIKGKNLVHFAAFKNHIGFYPSPSAIIHFEENIKTYVHAKGSIRFPIKDPLPLALIQKMVQFRMAEISAP